VTDSSPMGSVDKALRALDVLAGEGAPGIPLVRLAHQLGVNKATLHRTLAALRYRDYVVQDPETGNYLLGSAATGLAETYLQNDHLPTLLHPALQALCLATGELVHLGVLNGTDVVYLEKIEPPRPLRVWSTVGARSPAPTTALGRAMLAYRPVTRSSISPYLTGVADSDLDSAGARLWAAIGRARERGFASENQENEPGIACVAVPLIRGGTAVAAVSVTAPVERMDDARLNSMGVVFRDTLTSLLPREFHLPAELTSTL